MNEFIRLYRWGLINRVIKPEYEDYKNDHLLTIEQLMIKRYKRKSYLFFEYYSEFDNFFVSTGKKMHLEKVKINYFIVIFNKIIEKTGLSYDLRYIFVSFLV